PPAPAGRGETAQRDRQDHAAEVVSEELAIALHDTLDAHVDDRGRTELRSLAQGPVVIGEREQVPTSGATTPALLGRVPREVHGYVFGWPEQARELQLRPTSAV
ncbi:hypothetical protein RZS08_63340, partial [Arthrospira platensis SPKY1]|nr:hypothetical protein [Arthrospira platensis SPKY1]